MAKLRLQQALQEKEKLSNFIIKFVGQKNFELAKQFFDRLKPTGQHKAILEARLLSEITTDFTQEDIQTLLDTFNINIKTLCFQHKLNLQGDSASFTAAPIIMDLLEKYWTKNPNQAKSLFAFFIKQGLPLESEKSYNNALIHTITKHPNNLGFIEMLLKQGNLDTNALITPDTDKTCKFSKTPFSVAISRLNEDLLLLLLNHKADPYLAIKSANKYMKAKHGKHKKYILSSGFSNNGLNDEEQQDYFYKVNHLIEDFFLKKLITELTTAAQESDRLEDKEAELEKKEGKKLLNSYKESETIDKYITYKQNASQDINLSEEVREKHTFESLILEWIKTKNPKYLDSISELLETTSIDQYNYYIKCLIELNPSNDDASELLATTPSLLHKFCALKKKLKAESASSKKEESGTLELQDGVYEIKSGFKNKIFLKISPKILKDLSAAEGYVEKVIKQLNDPKFIKANSMGISGIKDYPGQNISKLKIAKVDANLVSLTRHLDEDGNLIIEFDHFMTHKAIDRFAKSGKKGVCIKCKDIESMVYIKAAKEALASPEAAPEIHESYSSVAILGEEGEVAPYDLE